MLKTEMGQNRILRYRGNINDRIFTATRTASADVPKPISISLHFLKRGQGIESATFWQQSGRHPDTNLDSNSRPFSAGVKRLGGGLRSPSTVIKFQVCHGIVYVGD